MHQIVKPLKRRAPPANLSGLSAEEIVARRNRMAREYARLVQERRVAAQAMLEKDAAALRVAREVMENAPSEIAFLTLSGDISGLVLYINGSGCRLLETAAEDVLGRCVMRSIFDGWLVD